MLYLTSKARVALAAGATAALLSGGTAMTVSANPGDQYILPVDHLDQGGNFEVIPNAGAVETSPGVFSNAYRHVTNPGNPFGGDIARIYWRVNIPSLPVEPRLYALEWWDPTAGSDPDFHIIETIFRGDAGEVPGVDNTIPWAGQSNTNKQWQKTNVSAPGGSLWRQAGPGPQAPASADYLVSGGSATANGNPGGNPPVSFVWLKQGSLLYGKWDFNFGSPDGTFIDRTYAELRLTEVPVAGSTLYWDVNQTAAGAGNGGAATSPAGNWNGTSPNFIMSSTGSGPAATRSMTYPGDTINFAAGTAAINAYTVTVSGTRYAQLVNIEEGNPSFTGGSLAVDAFNVPTGTTTTVSSTMVGGSAGSFTKVGAGTLVLTGTSTYTGGTTVADGKLVVNRMHENNAVSITGGTLQVADSSPTLPGTPSGNNASVSRPSSVSIANNGAPLGSRTYNATLDLGNNDLIIDYTSTSPVADIEDMIRSGYANGTWTGTGITSSTAANILANGNYALAIADNSQLTNKFGNGTGGKPQFSGQNVDDTTLLVKFTHRVDLDLDGLVTVNDGIIFATNYLQNGNGNWASGDVDYDGKHTQNDAIIFATFYNATLPSLPEPGVLGAGSLLLLGLGGRRSRRQR